MATLTGAQGVATGLYHAAVVTNNEDWEKASVCAGKSSGDLVVMCAIQWLVNVPFAKYRDLYEYCQYKDNFLSIFVHILAPSTLRTGTAFPRIL